MNAADRLGLAALLCLTACAADLEPEPELDETEAQSYNAQSYNALVRNALTANREARVLMIDVPLATESYDGSLPELADQLHDATTREFMSYLVSCALAPDQVVMYEDRFDLRTYKWKGSLGLCTSWNDGPASSACQEVVSSCLLARNNAFGRRVAISLRGPDEFGDPLPLGPTEIADFQWREGAFFGNLFAELATGVDVYVDGKGIVQGRRVGQVTGSIYPQMWACWSDIWTFPSAYERNRICAGGHTDCAATSVGACRASREPAPINRCATDDSFPAGDKDYQQCQSQDAAVWGNALTVFLANACDVVPTACDHI